ncbi:MAG: hypothetical protein M1133_09395 [Armatimonadetes bacterium]|nr:hypothetical protein [Armatimonadota bacterium]
MQHTHVDVGYSEPQPIVLRKHAEFIAQALDYCTATDHLPPGERFTWACEVSWTVRTFLDRYPERADEFFRRIREGRIEVAGIYLQLTDLFTEELLECALDYAKDLARKHDFEVVTAMNDDVNGWPWGLPRMMFARGIRYFDTAINETRALGVRPRPSPFYWASPDGSRVLMWHGNGYLDGNLLRLGEPGAEDRVANLLSKLETSGYPHSAVEMRISGEFHDNAPPGLWVCDAVHNWNARYEYPRLRLCTPREWFEHLESKWPEPIREFRAGWPDWWADGNGSAVYEASLVRAAQANILTAEAAAAAGCKLDRDRLDQIKEDAMFFCEHTWGAWCSTDDPHALESRAQWNIKSGFAYRAAVESNALVRDTIRMNFSEPGDGPEIVVFNPLPFLRSDVVEVVIRNDALGGDPTMQVLGREHTEDGPALHLVDKETGKVTSVDRRPTLADSSRRPSQLVRFIASDVPACGFRQYRVMEGSRDAAPCTQARDLTIENEFFRLALDEKTGGISSLIHHRTGRELVVRGDYSLNQHIHEIIDSRNGREALSDWTGMKYDTPFCRSTPDMTICQGRAMPFGASLVVEGGGGEFPMLRSEIILYDDIDRIDLLNYVTKPPIDRAEAIYHAFPLGREGATVYLDVPGAVMRPGLDQVPGTATDWHSIQHYFAVEDGEWTTVVASPDVPLVQVNGINTGKWQPTLPPHNGLVMSWVMNNYWFTNFPATQNGRVSYSYSLCGYEGHFDADKSSRFAKSIRQQFVAVVLPFGGKLRP